MTPIRKLLIPFCILALVMLACSVTFDFGPQPSSATATPTLSGLQQVSTMVAGTLEAFTQQALSATPANTPPPSATATPTNTSLPPALSVSVATNCYAGSSTNYGFVITIYPGITVTVEGKDPEDNYWIVDVPNYPGTICWLSGQYASVTGDTGNLPAPATPVVSNYTLSEPRSPRVSCSSTALSSTPDPDDWWWDDASQWTVVFRWANTDNDQTGVRVYRNGHQIATLHAHASSYTDTFVHFGHWDVTYGAQAFNGSQVSSIVTVEVHHCG